MKHNEFGWNAADGLQLFAQSWEPEDHSRGVFCLVHGLGEHSGRYAHMAAYLTQAAYTVLSYDLRGHGRSAGKRGFIPSYDALMDDVATLLQQAEARYPGKVRFLYGHSLGGNQVINFCLRRKPTLAGVIASAPGLRLAFDPPAAKLALGKFLYRLAPGVIIPNGLDVHKLSRDPSIVKAYQQDPWVHDRVNARLGLDLITTGEWALEHAADFDLPLLLMHGSADGLTSAQASRDFAQRAGKICTLKIWDGLFHEIHNEAEQDQVFAVMVDWMNERSQLTGQIDPLMAKFAPKSN